jgi:hypothetical protein
MICLVYGDKEKKLVIIDTRSMKSTSSTSVDASAQTSFSMLSSLFCIEAQASVPSLSTLTSLSKLINSTPASPKRLSTSLKGQSMSLTYKKNVNSTNNFYISLLKHNKKFIFSHMSLTL